MEFHAVGCQIIITIQRGVAVGADVGVLLAERQIERA